MMKQIWINGQEPNGRIVSREGWIDCGPAEPLTRKDRAYLAMQYFEKRGRTGSAWYELARQITIKEVFGGNFGGNFNIKGCETGRVSCR